MLNTQGVNQLLNVFFGVSLNAAREVMSKVETSVNRFVTNFITAINPQIMKSYAAGNYEYMYHLVCRGAKYSYLDSRYAAGAGNPRHPSSLAKECP